MIKALLENRCHNIGLDIGAKSIKMLQMEHSQDTIRVRAADRATIKTGLNDEERREFIVDTIKGMIDKGGFRGRNVITSISNDAIRIKSLRVDDAKGSVLNQMIHDEVAGQLGLDPENDEIRYIVAGKVHHSGALKDEVIFLGIDRETIKKHIDVLLEAGLMPVGIDPVACALMRSFTRSLRRQSDQMLVNFYIDIGSKYTTVLIGNNQQISFIKHIPIGGDNLNEEVAKKLNVSDEDAYMLRLKLRHKSDGAIKASTSQAIIDAMTRVIDSLVQEVSLCFRYYAVTFRGVRPGHVLLTGGEAYETYLNFALRKQLNLEIELAQPLRGIDAVKANKIFDEESNLCEWAVATGLSLKGYNFNNHKQETHERN